MRRDAAYVALLGSIFIEAASNFACHCPSAVLAVLAVCVLSLLLYCLHHGLREAFQRLLSKVGLSEAVCEVLKKRGFTTAAETHWAWANGAEDTFKAILTEAKVDLGTAPNALQSIPAGKLRRLRSECKALCEVPDLSAASNTSLALATIPQGSAGPAVSTRLSTCDREKRGQGYHG